MFLTYFLCRLKFWCIQDGAVPATFENQVWRLFFDETLGVYPPGDIAAGVGVVFVSPQSHVMAPMFTATNPCSNNVVEYDALLIA